LESRLKIVIGSGIKIKNSDRNEGSRLAIGIWIPNEIED
jgi:hypothetical protein